MSNMCLKHNLLKVLTKGNPSLRCMECAREARNRSYHRNKPAMVERNRKFMVKRRELIQSFKDKPCVDCGVKYPYYVMDFDHKEGELKNFNLATSAYKDLRRVQEEMCKCDLVCANCHRERTHQRRLVGVKV